MRETIKAICGVVLVLTFIPLAMVVGIYMSEGKPPAGLTSIWPVVIPGVALVVTSLAVLVFMHLQKDAAPDYLRRKVKNYFERSGFCFAIVPAVIDRRFHLLIYYQTRYSGPAQARIILRPTQRSARQASLAGLDLRVGCPPAAFGLIRVPMGVPSDYQGTTQTFELWASVTYPEGSGKMLRFHDGMAVGEAPASPWAAPAMVVAGAMLGMIVIPGRAARLTLALPHGVNEAVPDDAEIRREVIWKLGDPPLTR